MLPHLETYCIYQKKHAFPRSYFTFSEICPAVALSSPLHRQKALWWWQLEFVGLGEGGRVEIAKLWEPRQCAEDEGREGGKGGGRVQGCRHNGVGMQWIMRLHWHRAESKQTNQSNGCIVCVNKWVFAVWPDWDWTCLLGCFVVVTVVGMHACVSVCKCMHAHAGGTLYS